MGRARACRHAPCTFHGLNLSHAQNLKPHDDKSEDSDDDSEFDALAEEVDSN